VVAVSLTSVDDGHLSEGLRHIMRHPFFLPYVRLELLIRSIRVTDWDRVTWRAAKEQLRRALELRRHLARHGWWN